MLSSPLSQRRAYLVLCPRYPRRSGIPGIEMEASGEIDVVRSTSMLGRIGTFCSSYLKLPSMPKKRDRLLCHHVHVFFSAGVLICSDQHARSTLIFLSLILKVMVGMLEHPSLEIAELALEFWGLLGELLTETSAGGRGPRSPALEESVRRACVMAMLRARYPAEGAGGLAGMDGDARDELEDFREQVLRPSSEH